MIVLTHDFSFLVFVSDLTHDFFDQILDRDQSRHSPILVDHDGHANIVLLHLAQKFAPQLTFGYKIHIFPHERVQGARVRLSVRHLQNILRVNDSLNVMNRPFEHWHTGKRFHAQQFNELLDRGIGRDGDDFRPRLHRLSHRLFAKFHDRLDHVTVALVQDSFLLTGFNQRIHGFRLGFRLFIRMPFGQSGYRL